MGDGAFEIMPMQFDSKAIIWPDETINKITTIKPTGTSTILRQKKVRIGTEGTRKQVQGRVAVEQGGDGVVDGEDEGE